MSELPDPYSDLKGDERELWRWRYQAAIEAGIGRQFARMLADLGIEAKAIRDLHEKDCPPDLIVELLV